MNLRNEESTAFEDSVNHTLKSEGGYVDHPTDPGGETNFGISKRSYPHIDIKNLTRDQAKEIYYRDYWVKCGCDDYDESIGFQVFDAAVNHGRGNAVRMLQRAVGVVDDGIIGPVTKKAIQDRQAWRVVMGFIAERIEFWCKLSTWETFGKGWARRAAENLRIGAEL